MQHHVIVVTGAAGFLGSALTADLCGDNSVVAVDRRDPGRALLDATPRVEWHRVDISDKERLRGVFEDTERRHGRIDFVVHLAAFYHFDLDWHPEYERTNVRGTANVVQAAIGANVTRLIFSSSMVAMEPPAPGALLDERTPASAVIPYGRSKSMNEEMIARARDRLPSIVLRLGGVFSDWCELPPLSSLIKLWSAPPPLDRIVVGRGGTGIPYLHRSDWVRLVRACIDRNDDVAPHEVFLAAEHGTVTHEDLFVALRRARSRGRRTGRSIHLPPAIALLGLHMKMALGRVTGKMPYERPWMLDYIDRPWTVDTTHTTKRLGWECSQGMRVRDRLPVLLERFDGDRPTWERRNRLRATGLYSYLVD